MNFNEICNEASTLLGMQGSISTVESVNGIQKILVESARKSWIDIQTMREDWSFMNASNTSFSTVVDQIEYTPLEVFGSSSALLGTYKRVRGIFYLKYPLTYVQWEDWPMVNNDTPREPWFYTYNPQNMNLFLSRPGDIYPLDIRYTKANQKLLLDADVPMVSEQFHNAIVYRTVARMAAHFGNASLYNEYSREANLVLGELMRNYIRARTIYPRGFI